jgi:hypothetical protein
MVKDATSGSFDFTSLPKGRSVPLRMTGFESFQLKARMTGFNTFQLKAASAVWIFVTFYDLASNNSLHVESS